jgi:acetyltransferase-like isoleucine patch superfamily enzyme
VNETSFLNTRELEQLGLGSFGQNVLISSFARFYNPGKIHLGNYVRIDDFCILSGGMGIRLGNFIHIGAYTSIYGNHGVRIDDYCNISNRVAFFSESDNPSGETMTNPMVPRNLKVRQIAGSIHLNEHCIVFSNSTVLPGVTLQEGSVLGAHSLANRDLPPWTICAGNPAKPIKTRKSELLKQVPFLPKVE